MPSAEAQTKSSRRDRFSTPTASLHRQPTPLDPALLASGLPSRPASRASHHSRRDGFGGLFSPKGGAAYTPHGRRTPSGGSQQYGLGCERTPSGGSQQQYGHSDHQTPSGGSHQYGPGDPGQRSRHGSTPSGSSHGTPSPYPDPEE